MPRLEIVDYLRSYAGGALELIAHKRADEAADEITRLREENARLNSELSEERERVTVLEDELFLLEQKDCNEENYLQSQLDAVVIERNTLREENARLREGRMAEQEREELIEKMRKVLINARLMGFDYESAASAALAVAEPVIREKCAKIIEPSFPRPCDCETCYCGNRDDAERVAAWDEATANAKAIREG